MSTVRCPTQIELDDLIAGRLTQGRHQAIEAHVHDCSNCQAVLETLSEPHDSFLATLRDAVDPSPLMAARPLQQVLGRLKTATNTLPHANRLNRTFPEDACLGDFRILRELGRGGMGVVYEAEQVSLGRRVALKILSFGVFGDQRQLQRFHNEARAAASLDHPNIVSVFGVGVERGVHYYAMRHIDGHNLAQIIERLRQRKRSDPSRSATVSAQIDPTPNDRSPLADLHTTNTERDPRYIAAVARLGIQTARALDYAHDHGIVHRDIKPSNLMLDQTGRLWVTDFGLARIEADPTISMSGGLAGTLRYMSPEQALGKRGVVDHRSDVYALGVTLYELLTLIPIFPEESQGTLLGKIATDEPRSVHRLNPGIPPDLETIVKKAMAKSAADRYATAGQFADDLQRFLEGMPILARPVSPLQRGFNWVRHHRAWAAALGVFFLSCVGVAVAEIRYERKRAIAAEQQQREQRREILTHEMQRIRLLPHLATLNSDWFDDGWALAREAAQIRPDEMVRDQAAAFLSGTNGRLSKSLRGFEASSVALDADGERALIGGNDEEEAKIWDSKTDRLQKSGMVGAGPVAFRPEGAAWQLVATNKGRFPLVLWDVSQRRPIRELKPASGPDGARDNEMWIKNLIMAPEGGFAAAFAVDPDGAGALLVWNTVSGKLVRKNRPTGRPPTAIAVSSDGNLLAAGDIDGQVVVWPLPDGKEFLLPAGRRSQLNCLAFGPNVKGRFSPAAAGKWLLAGGDAGGTVTVWDLSKQAPISYCRGSVYRVDALAFSPDGATLASAGHDCPRLWDIATGRNLLHLGPGSSITGMAFSRDTKKLAISTAPGVVEDRLRSAFWMWDLESHRGVQTLHGLASEIPPTKVCLSRDARRIAALSIDWRAAIWDLPTGSLHDLFDVTPGTTADNAGLGFSHDGRKFAVAAGNEARMWDLETGDSLVWQLPPGLQDLLFFDDTGKRLFLFRMETADWTRAPDGGSPSRRSPRVGRMRDLLASENRDLRQPGQHNPTWQTDSFKARIFEVAATADGRYIVVGGEPRVREQDGMIKVFDSATGQEVLSKPNPGYFHLEPVDKLLCWSLASGSAQALIEIPTGKFVDFVNQSGAYSPGARLVSVELPNGYGNALLRRRGEQLLVRLGIDTRSTSPGIFSLDGSRLAWGNQDGTVTVCYLEDIQKRLAGIGLGW
jgi:serine/threonine protein kinase/WD40 repeat protein